MELTSHERKQFEIGERCLEIHEKYGWKCQIPGCAQPSTEVCHRISKSKANKKYVQKLAAEVGYIVHGDDIIHHSFNLIVSCSNKSHNSFFNIGNRPVERDELIIKILNDLIEKGKVVKI